MILSFTGHRPDKLGGYGAETDGRLFVLALGALRPRLGEIDEVITGMAQGWDTAIAKAALALGIPYCAAVPFVTQELKWPAPARERFYKLLERADRYVCVCEGGYAAWKMQKRNEWMVDNSDALVVLWDGSDGGTANCVTYAIRKQKPWTNLWEHYKL